MFTARLEDASDGRILVNIEDDDGPSFDVSPMGPPTFSNEEEARAWVIERARSRGVKPEDIKWLTEEYGIR